MQAPKHSTSSRAWVDIDLESLRHNYQQIRSTLSSQTKMLAVLKANAYGHGAILCARELEALGVDAVGIANVDEAAELRSAGVNIQVVVLGGLFDEEIAEAIELDVDFCVSSLEEAALANSLAKKLARVARVHLMVDTGMGRLGVLPRDSKAMVEEILAMPNLKLAGIATHFSCPAEEDSAFSDAQIAQFTLVTLGAQALGAQGFTAHAASHTALLKFENAHFDMVRPGLALFGMHLAPKSLDLNLRPVLSLHAKVLHVKEVEAGRSVSYSRLWVAKERTKIATVAIGYNDGFRVGLTGKAEVLLEGKRCPVVGRVTMDYIMVDIGADSSVKRGDVATIIGKQATEEIHVQEIASALGTVPYEFFCGIGKRVGRREKGALVSDSSDALRLVA